MVRCFRDAVESLPRGHIVILSAVTIFLSQGCGDAAAGPEPGNEAVSVEISPANPLLALGSEVRLDATARDSRGAVLSAAQFTWSSSDPGVARVDQSGLVTGVGPGSAQIRAIIAGSSGPGAAGAATVAVNSVTLAIAPGDTTMTAIGDTLRLTTVARDGSGETIASGAATWRSTVEDVVSVDDEGAVISRKAGVALVIATLGAATDSTVVRVDQIVARLDVTPEAVSLTEGDSIRIMATAYDERGHVVPSADVDWESDTPSTARPSGNGWVRAHAPGEARISVSADGQTSVAAVTVAPGTGVNARAADDFVNSIGVNIRIRYFDSVYGTGYETIIKPRLRELGVRHFREGLNVYDDRPNWMNERFERFREVAEETGGRFTIVMNPKGDSKNYSDMSHVRTILDNVGWENVEAFEGLNEHDLFGGGPSWAAQVRTAQQALYEEIKNDPELANRYAVLGPSLGRPEKASTVGDIRAYMDYAVMHPYPGGRQPTANIDEHYAKLRPMNDDLPIVVTETGYHTAMATRNQHRPVSEEAMGTYMSRLFLEYFDAGIVRTFAHQLIDLGTNPREVGQNFGLLKVDGSEKPAFRALRNLIRLVEDPGPEFQPGRLAYTLDGDTANLRTLLLQKRDGRFYLAVWQAVDSYDRIGAMSLNPVANRLTVRLGAVVASVNVYHPLEGSAPVATYAATDEISLDVPDHATIIEITR